MLRLVTEVGQPMKSMVPWTAASLRGWKRLDPGSTGPPLSPAIMMSIVGWLAGQALGQAALRVRMLFAAYLSLWDLTYPLLRVVFQQAAVAVEARSLGASLPFRRHGGASHDRPSTARSLLDVQVQRYEKFALVAKEFSKLKANTLQAAHQATEMLLHNSERVIEPLFGKRRASTGSSWSSSLAKEGSAPHCADMAEQSSRLTSATVRTLTSPTLK